jgi:hypothetical protein
VPLEELTRLLEKNICLVMRTNELEWLADSFLNQLVFYIEKKEKKEKK